MIETGPRVTIGTAQYDHEPDRVGVCIECGRFINSVTLNAKRVCERAGVRLFELGLRCEEPVDTRIWTKGQHIVRALVGLKMIQEGRTACFGNMWKNNQSAAFV